MIEAQSIPASVDVDAIAEAAMQSAFKTICDGLTAATDGAKTWGDMDPMEQGRVFAQFQNWVRSYALNNEAIQKLQPRA